MISMLWRRTLLVAAATALMIAGPEPAVARDCEDICADLAARNCERISSVSCGFYIAGCLAGCSVGQIVVLLNNL